MVRFVAHARTHAVLTVVALVAVLVSACGPSAGGTDPSAPASAAAGGSNAAPPVTKLPSEVVLRVLASNELKDMKPILAAAQEATNVKLDLVYVDTPAGAPTVGSGDQQYDAVWFDSNAYVALQPEAKRWVATSNEIMSSPVALGLDAGVAKRLGWDKKAPTWRQIAEAAAQRKFTYAMSNPATSNPALATLATVATAFGSSGSALQVKEIDSAKVQLRRFFSAQSMTSSSAAALADRFVKQSGQSGAPQGLVNYESTLIGLNASGKLKKPLTVVIPADGVISADFPMTLLNAVSKEARQGYRTLTDWLRSPAAQQMIVDGTARRPVVAGVKLDKAKFGDRLLIELPFPTRRTVISRLLSSYENSTRQLTQSIYVLDLSGSMAGQRIADLRAAMVALAGGKGSSGYATFRPREKVTLIGYDDQVRPPRTFTLGQDPEEGRARIAAAARGLSARGDTATYSALRRAYQVADQQVKSAPDAITSIVLMTDGERNAGISAGEFSSFYRDLGRDARQVPTFTIKFGTVKEPPLDQIAKLTGGKVFPAEDRRLVKAFRQIRAYQ